MLGRGTPAPFLASYPRPRPPELSVTTANVSYSHCVQEPERSRWEEVHNHSEAARPNLSHQLVWDCGAAGCDGVDPLFGTVTADWSVPIGLGLALYTAGNSPKMVG
jgi:hypothetical protein